MPQWLGPVLTVASYLSGSISFGLVAARRAGVDLRAHGSGNIGATNVGRALGKKTGRIVLVLDVLKGLLPTLAARLLLGTEDPWVAAVGFAATLGHVAPVFHRFRGGKGAATAAGVLLAAVPVAGALAAAGYLVGKKLTARASVGSLAGAALGFGVTGALYRASPLTAMAGAIFVLVVVRHVSNIGRLLRGEEPPS